MQQAYHRLRSRMFFILVFVFFGLVSGWKIVQATQTFSDSIAVPSLRVGAQGVGGVTFFNGTIVNETTDENGADMPVTFGDNVRIDGRVFRGAVAGAADTMPFIINDSLEVEGDAVVKGAATFQDDVTFQGDVTFEQSFGGVTSTLYTGTIDTSLDANELAEQDYGTVCTEENGSWTKYWRYYYRQIDIPGLDVTNPPAIRAYTKLDPTDENYTTIPNVDNIWASAGLYFSNNKAYILYKTESETCDETVTDEGTIEGPYRLVVLNE